jgi:hypothetical protein
VNDPTVIEPHPEVPPSLPIVAQTLAPSLLDDGDVESHPGPVTPMGQWVDKNEEHIMFNSSLGEPQYTSYEREYSDSDDAPHEEEFDYDVNDMTDPRLTEHIIVDFLNHMDTAENEALKAEQDSRGRAAKPVVHVRQMKEAEIQTASFNFNIDIDQNTMLRIAYASVTGPTVDPSFLDILTKLSGSSKPSSRQHECLVFLFLKSIEHLLHKEDPISFVLNVLLQSKYNSLHSLDPPAAASPMEELQRNGKEPAYMIVASMLNAAQSAHAHYYKHTVVTLQDITEELA